MKKHFLSIFFLFLFSPLSFADIVIMKDGRRFEGKIVEQDKDSLVILVNKGTYQAKIPLKLADISKVQKQKKTSWEELREDYFRRKKALLENPIISGWDSLAQWCKRMGFYHEEEEAWGESLKLRENLAKKVGTPSVWFRLAKWAREKKFYKKALELYQKVLKLDPNHPEAREALGYKRFQNAWLAPREYEAKVEEDMRLRGYVKYQGKWYNAQSLEILLRIKKIEQNKAIKELKGQYERIVQKTEGMEKLLTDMTKIINTLQQKINRQNTFIEGLYRRILDNEARIKTLEQR